MMPDILHLWVHLSTQKIQVDWLSLLWSVNQLVAREKRLQCSKNDYWEKQRQKLQMSPEIQTCSRKKTCLDLKEKILMKSV